MSVEGCAYSRLRKCGLLPTLAFAASLATTISAGAQEQSGQFDTECARKEITALTLIEEHAAADDLPADRLGNAGLALLRARSACYQGRVGEALALYESILDLGPVASLNRQ